MVVKLTAAENERLAAAVAAAERQTGAEIVLAVNEACDDYAAYPWIWAGALGFVFAGALALVWPDTHIRNGFLGAGLFMLLAALVLHLPALRLILVPKGVEHDHAIRAARLHFASHVAGRTVAANGLLIFVALGERYVEIVADAGIARVIPEKTWSDIVNDLLAEVRAGRLVAGLEQAVAKCAGVLAGPFPYQPGDRNEISDAVVLTKR